MERVLVERFAEALVTNADDLSAYLHPDVELVTLLDGLERSGKHQVLAILRRASANVVRLEGWAVIEHTEDATLVHARFVARRPDNVVQGFDVVWRLTLERGLIRRIQPFPSVEEARQSTPRDLADTPPAAPAYAVRRPVTAAPFLA